MYQKPTFLCDIETESKRRFAGLAEPDKGALANWNQALESITEQSVKQLNLAAYEFAKRIEYRHSGMTPEIYFCHPMRVAALSIFACNSTEPEVGVVGLLHNVLEVSTVTYSQLVKNFGKSVADQIACLTVDRKLEWDKAYKKSYYRQINMGPRAARIVKVIDKLDNIFTVNNNPSSRIRVQYLQEIETHVVPMAQHEFPDLAHYLEQVIAYNRSHDPETHNHVQL